MADKKDTPPPRPQRERERKEIGNYNDQRGGNAISFDRPIPPPKPKK